MTSYTAGLSLKVGSKGVGTARRGLKGIAKDGAKAERATDKLAGAFARLIGPMAAVAALTAGANKLFNVTKAYGDFQATLDTATGSAENAAIAFEALENFAKTTPFTLEQSIESFVKLKNLGLEPSERAMTSFGNTASAMGKDLNDMIEAVADAATNEFERLKEFGIVARQQGDDVSFTFKGVTTTIKKNAENITKYLTELGEINFDGSMEKRMEKLSGAWSNMEMQWDSLFRSIAGKGIDEMMLDGVNDTSEALQDLEDIINSGQIEQGITAIGSAFLGYQPIVDEVTRLIEDAFEYWGKLAGLAGESIADNMDLELSHIPENIRTLIRLAVVEFAALGDYGATAGEAFAKTFGAKLAYLVDVAGIYAKELGDTLNVFDGDSFDHTKALEVASDRIDGMTDSYFRDAEKKAEMIRQTRLATLTDIIKDRDVKLNAMDAEIDKIAELGAAYEKEAARRAATGLDDIPDDPNDTPVVKGPDQASKAAFAKLIDNVIPPEDKINEVFAKRLALIEENTVAGSEKQAELLKRLNNQYATEVLDGFEVEIEENDFEAKADLINEEWKLKREVIMNNVQLTEDERTALETKLTEARNQKLKLLEDQKLKAQLGVAKSMFGNLSSLMGSESKKLFKIGKVAAIAQATISGLESVVHSYKFGSSIGGPALGAAFAATAAIATGMQIQQIASQQFGGGGTVTSTGGGTTSSVYQSPKPTAQNDQQFDAPQIKEFHFHGDWRVNNMKEFLQEMDEYIEETDHVSSTTINQNRDAA